MGGIVRPLRGLVVHVIVGSLLGADSTFHNNDPGQRGGRRSATWGIGKDGRLLQWCDTDDVSWAQADGNRRWHSVETEGTQDEPLTAAQIEALARLLEWDSRREGYPLAAVDDPNGWGLGTHAMGGAAWGGHSCPGAIRAAQRPAIVARAVQFRAALAGIGVVPAAPIVVPPPVGTVSSVSLVRHGRRYMQHTVNVPVDQDGNGFTPTDYTFAGAIVQNRAIQNPRMPPAGNGRYKLAYAAGLDNAGKLDVVVMGAIPSPPPPAAPWIVPVQVDVPD